MLNSRIKTKDLLQSQIPQFLFDESTRILEFLGEYYNSAEYQGGPLDLLNNIDQYVKLDNIAEISFETDLTSNVTYLDTEVFVSSTKDFPRENGLIKINDEIILYRSKTDNSFKDCVRGFSGITSYRDQIKDNLVFSLSSVQEHTENDIVYNLSSLFLKEFFKKYKAHFAPGFESVEFYPGVNERLLLYKLKDFYSSKGSDSSFDILFKAVFGLSAKVIKPRDYVLQASDSDYRINRDLIVERIQGDPEKLINLTLFQDEIPGLVTHAKGAITGVEKIIKNNKNYYKISLNYSEESESDKFPIHPKTFLTSEAKEGQNYLDVDSTLGFPSSGTLVIYVSDNTSVNITYTSKSSNQFFGCSGVINLDRSKEIYSPYYAYGYFNDEIIKVRIGGVLSDIDPLDETYFYQDGDKLNIVSLGTSKKDILNSSWHVNCSPYFDVLQVEKLTGFRYRVTTIDDNTILLGDSVSLRDNAQNTYTSLVIKVNNKVSFDVQLNDAIDTASTFVVFKNIRKLNAQNDNSLNGTSTNVQNVYSDREGNTYVTAPSLPDYLNTPLFFKHFLVTLNGFFDGYELSVGKHPFYTGDTVTYRGNGNSKLNIPEGTYYVKKINDTALKLATSKSNLYAHNYVFVNGEVTNNTLQLSKFAGQDIRPQPIIRKFTKQKDSSKKDKTTPGQIGMMLNGVELLSYKTGDFINYGPIERIIVSSPGDRNYDVINPPNLIITDPLGVGATGVCNVTGSLKRIDILENNYSFTGSLPKVSITGGNGSGAKVSCNVSPIYVSVEFSSYATAGFVDLSNNIIGFPTFHKFNKFEAVVYGSNQQNNIGGLVDKSIYYAVPLDANRIKLYSTYDNAVSGINTIDLTSYSTGIHKFTIFEPKNIISSIDIIDGGSGYSTKKMFFSPEEVNIHDDSLIIKNHQYTDKEIVTYSTNGTPITGLSSTSKYFIKVLDEHTIKLALVGVGSISEDYYYRNNLFVHFQSKGEGNHELNYLPISVKIESPVGIITFSGQDSSVKLNPIFRGEITSVSLKDKGIHYGDSEIINYTKQPLITVENGSDASITPIVSDGRIVDVIINNPGKNYASIPDLFVDGDGSGCVLSPVIKDKKLHSVIIIKPGVNYTQNKTTCRVVSSGFGVQFEAYLKSWNVNLIERLFGCGHITSDDGIVYNAVNKKFELEYCHAYAPRKFRQGVLSTSIGPDGETIYRDDLSNDTSLVKYHSPIVGWAYDGNPIYGPYGYADPEGGVVKRMKSSYRLVNSPLRPESYPVGFFVEDYFFDGDGDLDEYNGRYCKTPEFPMGTYAYFMTINNVEQSDGPFRSYLKPVFPYIIGDYFKSPIIPFNYNQHSTQEKIDLNSVGWLRNTYYYHLMNKNSGYDCILQPNKFTSEKNVIDVTFSGSVDKLSIVSPGRGYKVGDAVIFDNEGTGGNNAFANVSEIVGTDVVSIGATVEQLNSTQFVPYSNTQKILGVCTNPHNFVNNQIISIYNLNNYELDLNKSFSVETVLQSKLILTKNIKSQAFTGIVTFIDVLGDLTSPKVLVNDVYKIDNEKVKVLEIDKSLAKIKVLRAYDGTSGVAHSEGSIMSEDPRKFIINVGYTTSVFYNLNNDIYFNPQESLGKGSGVGIGTTIYFSHIGYGVTSKIIPFKSIYLKEHGLKTGDLITYSSSGNTPIKVSTGSTTYFAQDYSNFYVAKISNDLIGISTYHIGIGSTGGFVEIGTNNNDVLLTFVDHGTGFNHKFIQNLSHNITGNVRKIVATVTTNSNHNLIVNDVVNMDVKSGVQTSFTIQYNDANRRMVVNPKSFSALDVDINADTIKVLNHGYKTGQKVLHTSQLPCGGLETDKIYYVIVLDEHTIKLSNTYYETLSGITNLDHISLSAPTSVGTLSLVNPELKIFRDSTITFNLSDPSLSSSGRPAFSFDFYLDREFKDKFITSSDKSFSVKKVGDIGVDNNASVQLILDSNTPSILYYKLTPLLFDGLSISKKEIVTDSYQIINNNLINVLESGYNNNKPIIGVGLTYFKYSLSEYPEKSLYTSDEAVIKYYTKSSTALGQIHKISIENGGLGYKKLPSISRIRSGLGTDALILPFSSNIGKVYKYKINDIGFDYPTDKTLSPETFLPKIFKIEPLTKFKKISVISPGVNYFVAPQIIVLDGYSKRVNEEADLRYEIGNNEVKIVRNTSGVYNVPPIILPVNNPNGTRISSINYHQGTKVVTVGLAVTYSSINDFPFEVGDEVIIENTNIDIVEGGNGYNSSNYGYKLFKLTEVNADVGGENPTIKYSLSDIQNPNPGIFDDFESIGTVTPKKYFPIFKVELIKDQFISGETIISQNNSKGVAQSYDYKNEYLKINTVEDFNVGDTVRGESSNNIGLISQIISFHTKHNINSSCIVKEGWKDNIGVLDDNLQRIHDNDYYQYFSYSVKSNVSLENWDTIVGNLNHTLGFKRFSDLEVESYAFNKEDRVGLVTAAQITSLSSFVTIDGFANLNEYKDYDIAREKPIFIDESYYASNEILFNSPFLQKYKEFIGNKVLKIDDITSKFNDVNKSFDINNNNQPIFSVDFNGSIGSVVGLTDNTITLSNHFFVTGEEIEYIPFNNDPANAIGIGTTFVIGIGTTSKLPSSIYVIKIDSQKIQLAASPQNALLFNPIPITINSVGIGSTHTFRSKNTNTRALISLNGVIQSPIVSTAVTSQLQSSVGIGSTIFTLSGISSIFSGDLLKIDNEIVFVTSVGFGSTNNISVLRAWVGTSESSHTSTSLVTKFVGNYNIVGNKLNFSEPVPGPTPIGTTSNGPNEIDYIGITTSIRFDGRVFIRSALKQGYTTTYDKAYNTNYIFDNISQSFNGITSSFTLKQNNLNVTGFSTSNAIILIDDVFQGPQRLGSPLTYINGDYKLQEISGSTQISFTGNPANFNQTDDINVSTIPRGGIIVSVASSGGLRYQPLIGAGGTAIVSIAGTIQSISIGNSGSGYRVGVQTYIKVGVQTYSSGTPKITYVGYANASNGNITNVVITNPGVGYTSTNPPTVIIDSPLNYTDIPLIYSSTSPTGIGTGATVDITVGQGSSVINFELKNLGYGYGQGDVLTVPFGGTTGIPTDSSLTTVYPFEEFNLTVDKTFNSKFNGWSIGDIIVLDNIEKFFNGRRRIFPLSRNGERLSFFPRRSSGINLEYNLLVFINDILQRPGESYIFDGGSTIRFTEAPKPTLSGYTTPGDTCKLLIYTGTESIDVNTVDIVESIKIGDEVRFFSDADITLNQDKRLVVDIKSADTVISNTYAGQGVSNTELLERPINWLKQIEDKIIDDVEVGKDRIYYEPNIHTQCTIISNIGIGSTFAYVTTVKSLFDNPREGIELGKNAEIQIISNDNLIAGVASAVVSLSSTISSLTLINPGFGYSSNPSVTIELPGIGITGIASATANVSAGVITSFTITNPGFGYTTGPLNSLGVNQQGVGYPPLSSASNIFTNAKLKTLSGFGRNATATIEIDISTKQVVSIQVTNGGANYKVNDLVFIDSYDSVGLATTYRRTTLSSPLVMKVTSIKTPKVLISPPALTLENIENVTYEGDYGIIVGVGTTNVGVTTGIVFDFYIPTNSPLVTDGHAITKSGIQTGNYFVITNSSVGYGITSLTRSESVLGIGTENLDNIYEVYSTSQVNRFIDPIGITTVIRVTTKVSNYYGLNTAVGIASTSFYATYSWGKVNFTNRSMEKSFTTKTNLFSGISSNPIIRRKNPLAYKDYF